MIGEKAFLEVLQNEKAFQSLKMKFYFEIAPETAKEPFAVLYSVTNQQSLETGSSRVSMQLDVFHKTVFSALELSDRIVSLLHHAWFRTSEGYIQGIVAQRTPPLRVEDGTCKVPVDIRFFYKEYSL